MRNLTSEETDVIINLGAFQYPAAKMANVLGWTEPEVTAEFTNQKSEFYKLYTSGKDKADYVIDLKLFELAQTGDLKALDEFENRKSSRE